MGRLRLVLFDVDGTLIDGAGQIITATRGAFAAHGLDAPSDADIRAGVGLSVDYALARLAPDTVDPKSLTRSYQTGYAEAARTAAVSYAGVQEGLSALFAQDWTVLGLATGKSRRGVDRMLRQNGWERRFHTVQTADTHPSKPHPSMVLTAMAEVGVTPEDTVMIGDTTYDMLMARAAGVRGIGVDWGYHDSAALTAAGAYCVLSQFSDIAPALDRMWGAE